MQDLPDAVPSQESPDLPPPYSPPQKKSKKTWIIVLVVVIVLCCLCSCIGIISWLWTNGDDLMKNFQTSMQLLPLV
jgi:flagellar basal body-associated protein FliL